MQNSTTKVYNHATTHILIDFYTVFRQRIFRHNSFRSSVAPMHADMLMVPKFFFFLSLTSPLQYIISLLQTKINNADFSKSHEHGNGRDSFYNNFTTKFRRICFCKKNPPAPSYTKKGTGQNKQQNIFSTRTSS